MLKRSKPYLRFRELRLLFPRRRLERLLKLLKHRRETMPLLLPTRQRLMPKLRDKPLRTLSYSKRLRILGSNTSKLSLRHKPWISLFRRLELPKLKRNRSRLKPQPRSNGQTLKSLKSKPKKGH